MRKLAIFALVLSFALCTPAFAAGIDENANSDKYGVKASGMLIRGISNVGVAVSEIPVHAYEGTVDGMPVIGTIQGISEGAIWTLERAMSGVWDVATFWVPEHHGIVPTHNAEIMT